MLNSSRLAEIIEEMKLRYNFTENIVINKALIRQRIKYILLLGIDPVGQIFLCLGLSYQ